MNIFHNLSMVILIIVCTTNSDALDLGNVLRPQIGSLLSRLQSTSIDVVLYWNSVTVQAGANDYDTSIASVPDQPGPTFTSRSFAIIHGAMYEAMAVFNQRYKSLFRPDNIPDTSNVHKESAVNAAIMEAAYQTLSALYPKQQTIFDTARGQYLSQLKTNGKRQAAIDAGITVGQLISKFILASRQNDSSQVKTPYTPTVLPGYHQPDPLHPTQGFVGVSWGNVSPFLLKSGSQFHSSNVIGDNPTSRQTYLNSIQYLTEFNEVKSVGSRNSTVRTDDQTQIGNFWAYDGAPKIGVNVRLLNQIVRVIAINQKNSLEENAHLFALVNYGIADATIATWYGKYYYNFWRPVVAIRQATGFTQADPNWLPLGAPSSITTTSVTPAFPSYVSGHAALGCSTFEILRQYYETDKIKFEIQSDEYNGRTFDANTGQVRPAITRYYQSLSEAETENCLSRLYLGVHWRVDIDKGKTLGQKIGQFVMKKLG